MSEAALRLAGIERTFRQGGRDVPVLRGADLELRAGEMVALVAPSGAGKSTLLHVAGLLERPDAGRVAVAGREAADEAERTRLRRRHLGFVYQHHHLMPEFSALENVMMPVRIAGGAAGAARARASGLLARVGLAAREGHRPARLSGGEQQRVAVARAFAAGPDVLLADEPTGNLDPATASEVIGLFVEMVRGTGLAALVATHNPEIAARMDRTVGLEEGRLVPRGG